MKKESILIKATVVIVLAASPMSAEVLYNITDLGPGIGRSINNNGQIVGDAPDDSGTVHATLFDRTGSGNNIYLGTPGEWYSRAFSINDSNEIVGWSVIPPSYATLFDPTGSGNNTNLGEGRIYSINNSGQSVGWYRFTSETLSATLFDSTVGGSNINLGTLGGDESLARSVSNSGEIVGQADTAFGDSHATMFDPSGGGHNIDLGTLDGDNSIAYSINDHTQIVGRAQTASGNYVATLFDHTESGNNIYLGTLGGDKSTAYSINNNGQIVGRAYNASGNKHATIFDPTGNGDNIDLNNLIDPDLDWTLIAALCINNNGWIVGYGINLAGEIHAFLLTPISEPPIEADIDIKPNTINLQSKGKWISCDIRLGEEYDVADVNSYSVFLEDEIQAEWIWADEQEQVLMAKFSRSALQEMLAELETPIQVELLVTGELIDGTIFEGTDTIKVIDKGNKK